MTQLLKQSTAFTFRIGPFVDSTDGVTAETALTIAQADIQISKAGGAFAQTSAGSPTTTHDADGWYQLPLTTTDTNTLGTFTVQVIMAGALPVWKDFTVVPANVWDSLVGGTDLLDVNTSQVGGTAQTAGDIMADTNDIQARLPAALVSGRLDVSVGAMAANVLTAAATATDFVTEAQAAAAAAITAASLATAANVAAVETDTQDIQARLPAALVSGRMDASVGAMAANVMTAAAAASDLTTELQSGLATAAALAVVDGIVDDITAKTANLPTDPADQSSIIAATDAVMSRLGAPAGASLSADLAATKADTAAILLDTGTDGVVVAAASKTGYRLSSAGVNDVLRTALTEGYAAPGDAFTMEQALFMLWSLLAERAIAATTLTAAQLDGTTPAMTFTLDDADAPTSQTRAT